MVPVLVLVVPVTEGPGPLLVPAELTRSVLACCRVVSFILPVRSTLLANCENKFQKFLSSCASGSKSKSW